MKTCSKCVKEYPATLEFFSKEKGHSDGLHSWCKSCCNKASKKAQQKVGKAAQRKTHLKRKYGLTPNQHLKMYVDQDGCCAICKQAIPYSKICTDHNHETGKVRGLLCYRCNLGLGYIEIPGYLKSALEYLKW